MFMKWLIYAMIIAGAGLMVFNLSYYIRFIRRIRRHGSWSRLLALTRVPTVLLALFLAGYLAVACFGQPDLLIAFILLGGSVYVTVMEYLFQRIADQIQENERLEARTIAAEEASAAKTQFLFNMSHDIRTPLNAIIGYTTLAGGEEVTLSQAKSYVGKIRDAGEQLLDIVNDVLEMGRIESGKVDTKPGPVDLTEVIRKADDLNRSQLEQKGLRFITGCSVSQAWVLCDEKLLSRVLMNLLCNAGKFTESGEICLDVEQLDSDGQAGTYAFHVKDTGIGMSPEFASQVFVPFERERTTTVSGIQGTGLGMSIAKRFTELMGGTISLETEQGKGTQFTVTLRLPPAEPPRTTEKHIAHRQTDRQLRLLLAEDNAINQEIAVTILQQHGYTVETADNGRIAVEKLAASAPGDYAAVLMDIQMPVMDGYEATRRIRALENRELAATPVIAMTANAFKEDEEAALKAGMDGYITKPLDVGQMLSTIDGCIADRH